MLCVSDCDIMQSVNSGCSLIYLPRIVEYLLTRRDLDQTLPVDSLAYSLSLSGLFALSETEILCSHECLVDML